MCTKNKGTFGHVWVTDVNPHISSMRIRPVWGIVCVWEFLSVVATSAPGPSSPISKSRPPPGTSLSLNRGWSWWLVSKPELNESSRIPLLVHRPRGCSCGSGRLIQRGPGAQNRGWPPAHGQWPSVQWSTGVHSCHSSRKLRPEFLSQSCEAVAGCSNQARLGYLVLLGGIWAPVFFCHLLTCVQSAPYVFAHILFKQSYRFCIYFQVK